MAERFHSLDSSLHSEGLTQPQPSLQTTSFQERNSVLGGSQFVETDLWPTSELGFVDSSTRRKVAICRTRRHLCHRNSCQQSERFNYNCRVEINHGEHSQPVKFEDTLAQHLHAHTTPERSRDIHGRFPKGFAAAVVMLVFLEQSQVDVV